MLTKETLDNQPCMSPGCEHKDCALIVSGRCHLGEPVTAIYHKGKGRLEIKCAVCDREICDIAVGSHDHGKVRSLIEASNQLIRNARESDNFGPTEESSDDVHPRDKDGDLWYPDLWELKQATDALME